MALVVDPFAASPGGVIAAAEINARIAAILAQVNGNLDAANYKDASVTKVKLATDSLQAFLQLLAPATRRIAFGSGTWTWAGGTNEVGSGLIAHGLGVVPIFAMAIPSGVGTIYFGSGGSAGVFPRGHRIPDATNIIFDAACGFQPGAGGTTSFDWLAIG